jgi:hypothetical protein
VSFVERLESTWIGYDNPPCCAFKYLVYKHE